jgi:Spy/CpxP family protein refolding chaperone
MTASKENSKWLWLILFASVACNVGVIAAISMKTLMGEDVITAEPVVDSAEPQATNEGRRIAHRDGRRHRSPGMRPPLTELELSPEQRRELRPSRDTLIHKMKKSRHSLHEKHDALLELIMSDETDKDAIDTQLSLLADDRAAMQAAVIDHFLEIKQFLRPDQMKAYRKMLRWAIVSQDHQGPRREPGEMRGDRMRRGKNMKDNRPFPRGADVDRPASGEEGSRPKQRDRHRNIKETEE